MSAAGKVRVATIRLAKRFPFHAALLSKWTIFEDASTPTMGVRLSNSCTIEMFYNPEFVQSLSVDEVSSVVQHEVNHVIMGHLTFDPQAFEHLDCLVVAAETTANEFVDGPLPGKPIVLQDYPELQPDQSTLERYDILVKLRAASAEPAEASDLKPDNRSEASKRTGEPGPQAGNSEPVDPMPEQIVEQMAGVDRSKSAPDPAAEPRDIDDKTGSIEVDGNTERPGDARGDESGDASTSAEKMGRELSSSLGKASSMPDGCELGDVTSSPACSKLSHSKGNEQGVAAGDIGATDEPFDGQASTTASKINARDGSDQTPSQCDRAVDHRVEHDPHKQGRSPTLDDHSRWGIENRGLAEQIIAADVTSAFDGLSAQAKDLLAAALKRAVESQREKFVGRGQLHQRTQLERSQREIPSWGLLNRFIGSALERAPTYHFPSRRLPDMIGIVPGIRRVAGKPTVMAAIDTSGSMTIRELSVISAELKFLASRYDVTVVECDAAVQRTYRFNGAITAVYGGGGTDFRPLFERSLIRSVQPDLVLVFTDGFGPAPEKPPGLPVVWVLSTSATPASWGHVMRYGNPLADALPF